MIVLSILSKFRFFTRRATAPWPELFNNIVVTDLVISSTHRAKYTLVLSLVLVLSKIR